MRDTLLRAFIALALIILILFAAEGIATLGEKPTFRAVHENDSVPCKRAYTNSRGQTICIVTLPDRK